MAKPPILGLTDPPARQGHVLPEGEWRGVACGSADAAGPPRPWAHPLLPAASVRSDRILPEPPTERKGSAQGAGTHHARQSWERAIDAGGQPRPWAASGISPWPGRHAPSGFSVWPVSPGDNGTPRTRSLVNEKMLRSLFILFLSRRAGALPAAHLTVQFGSVTQSSPTLCDPMNRSMPGLPVHCQLPEFTQTHIHLVSDAIQPSHPLSYPSPPATNTSQHQSLFQ